ncbi:MAG TPA: response regulator [Thermodesulfobacteriota bacterium]|nr:response regulator [Thermodesulfobacteriota bacterium]
MIGSEPKQKKTILIVDDELGVRESLRQILKNEYEVYTAASGEEALECLNRKKIDLVTLDIKMPGMSGMEVLKTIKSTRKSIEVILITAYGTFSNADEAVLYGAGDFIIKPFDVTEVMARIGRTLERRKDRQRIKGLIQQIKTLLPMGESKEEDLLPITKNLCEMLKRDNGETSFAAEELSSFASFASRCSRWLNKEAPPAPPDAEKT